MARPGPGPADRGAAAACAELLGIDLATITEAAATIKPYLRADGTRVWSLMQLERQRDHRPMAGGEAATSTSTNPLRRRITSTTDNHRGAPKLALGLLGRAWMRSRPRHADGCRACWSPEGALMPATTEQIHRLFENHFNAGDLDGLMELYEADAALIAQPGSLANGVDQARTALQGFLSLKGHITLDTKLVVTVGELAYLANTWSLQGTDPDGNPVSLGATTAEVAGARPTAAGAM